MSNYKVLNDFTEKIHGNTVYRKGDTYPKESFEADQKRIEFLQKVHPTYGVPFLDSPVEEPKKLPKKPPKATTTSGV